MKNQETDKASYQKHFLSTAGIQISSPARIFELSLTDSYFQPRWTDVKRGKLIWKLKVRKGRYNKLKIILLMIVCYPIIFVCGGLLAQIFHSRAIASLMGILIAVCWIWLAIYLREIFETNPNYIYQIKHKGKEKS
jgi:hypothetical protein